MRVRFLPAWWRPSSGDLFRFTRARFSRSCWHVQGVAAGREQGVCPLPPVAAGDAADAAALESGAGAAPVDAAAEPRVVRRLTADRASSCCALGRNPRPSLPTALTWAATLRADIGDSSCASRRHDGGLRFLHRRDDLAPRFCVLFFIELWESSRPSGRLHHQPDRCWVTQQAHNFSFPGLFDRARFPIHDRDRNFTRASRCSRQTQQTTTRDRATERSSAATDSADCSTNTTTPPHEPHFDNLSRSDDELAVHPLPGVPRVAAQVFVASGTHGPEAEDLGGLS